MKDQGHKAFAGERISIKGDVRCLRWMMGALHRHLDSLATSEEQDAVELDDTHKAMHGMGDGAEKRGLECLSLAVRWRKGYKQVLSRALRWCDASLDNIAASL